jgi:hypothetical protein
MMVRIQARPMNQATKAAIHHHILLHLLVYWASAVLAV